MQTARTTKNRGWWLLIGLLLILFYLAFAFYDGPHRYNDSGGYMAMDVSREPMYPLFLWAVRLVFGGLGEAGWLQAAVVIQSLIAALSALFFVRTLSESFSLSRLSDLALSFFAAAPSLMCRFVANRRMMYSNSVLSEALAIPLFLVFMTWLLRAAYVGGRRSFSRAAFWGFVLISVRKQMLISLPLLVLTALWRGIKERRVFARLLSAVLLSAAVLLANNLLDRSYNYLVRGEFLRHTGDMRFVTTMLLYNAEPGDEQQIRRLKTYYEDRDMPFVRIGSLTDGTAGILRSGEEIRYLEKPQQDALAVLAQRRQSSCARVDFPLPVMPMMPRVSPRFTRTEMVPPSSV